MQISNRGLEFLKQWEELRLEAYPDPGSNDGEPWTIGYGHTGGVVEGQVATEEEVVAWLREDVASAEATVNSAVKVSLSHNQFDALVSFVYNVGAEAFRKSTLLRLLNNRDFIGAAGQLQRWNRNGGKVMAGLTNRRKKEEVLFLTPESGQDHHPQVPPPH